VIHPGIDPRDRARSAQSVDKAVAPSTPVGGRVAVLVFSQTVATGVTVVVPSIAIGGPHRLVAVRYHQNVVAAAGSAVNIAFSQDVLTTDAAFLADDALTAWFTQFVSLFPNTVTQRLPLNLFIPRLRGFYKVRFSNGSGGSIAYNVTFELQMIGVRS